MMLQIRQVRFAQFYFCLDAVTPEVEHQKAVVDLLGGGLVAGLPGLRRFGLRRRGRYPALEFSSKGALLQRSKQGIEFCEMFT
jgi:hypothetical protein